MKRLLCLFLVAILVSSASYAKPSSKKKCISPAQAGKYLKTTALMNSTSKKKGKTSVDDNILVVEADDDLLILANEFDLRDDTLVFIPAPKGRYAFNKVSTSFENRATEVIDLTDDDSEELIFHHFQFPFGKGTYDRCYINSNGNITFLAPDIDPMSVESLERLPRIAALFSDLNPENAGTVLVHQSSEKVTITWLKVPEFYNQNQFDYGENTFQIILFPDGRIHLAYDKDITATQGLVGIIGKPDHDFIRRVNFSSGKSPFFFSMVENFTNYQSIDIPLLMRAIYSGKADRYDFVTLMSNFDLTPVPGAQAFAINVRNNVRGIGNPSDGDKSIFKDNSIYGSSGKLQNITFLGNLHQYPSDPSKRTPDTNTSLLEILAHEIGHRWLAYLKIGKNGNKSNNLLGRNESHWSFFLDSRGSYLEGNQISNQGLDSYVTGIPFQRYSDIDLYLMGMIPPEQVSSTFYVDDASDFDPEYEFTSESLPEANVKFKGSARTLTIDDIIQANGRRDPKSAASQKQFRHLFVLIVKQELPATAEEIEYMDLLRSSWESFFSTATNGIGKMITEVE